MRAERDIQDAHVADPAAMAGITFTSGSQQGTLVTDLAAIKTAVDANNTAIDAIIVALEEGGIIASS